MRRRKAPDATVDQFITRLAIRADVPEDAAGASVITAKVRTPQGRRVTWRFDVTRPLVYVHRFTTDAKGQPLELAEEGRYTLTLYAGERTSGKSLGRYVLEVVPRRGGRWERVSRPSELATGRGHGESL